MKSLRNRLTVVLTFLAVLMISLGFVFMPKTANALLDTSTGFYIEDGARIRLENDGSGIKWTAHLTKSGYEAILAENTGLELSAIGISIIPSEYAGTNRDAEMRRDYYYDGDIDNLFPDDKTEFVYNWAVFYDELLEDLAGYANADELLRKAYDMELVATPFMILGGELSGDKIINGTRIEGEHFDTARSLKSVALSYYVDGDYPDKAATLLNYIGLENIDIDATDYVVNEYYSNYDGVGAITLDDNIVIANNTKIYYGAKDVTNLYNAETGKVALTGVSTEITKDGNANDFLTILHADGRLQKQYFIGVTLAIDEVADMDYFKLKKQAYAITQKVGSGYEYWFEFADGDFEYDGYYVLLNDIDFNSVKFDIRNGKLSTDKTTINTSGKFNLRDAEHVEKWASSYGLKKKDGTYKGLTGTFDGRGYSFKNFFDGTAGGGDYTGIFGMVLGGTIKNVGFINCGSRRSSYTIGAVVALGATMSNIYVKSSGKYNIGLNHSELAYQVSSSVTFDKIFMDVSYYVSSSYDGGFDPADRGYAQSGGAFTNLANDEKLTDYYQIGNTPMYRGKSGGTGTLWYTAADAKYINGEENTVGSVIYTNAKRYTSIQEMEEDVAVNNFDAWDPDIWVIKNGVPYFKSTIESNEYVALFDNAEITEDEIAMVAGNKANVTIKYGSQEVSAKPVLSIVGEDTGVVTISANEITAVKKGNSVIKATYGKYSWIINLSVANKPIDYELEYQFSAYDGLFFDGANVVDFNSIIANLTDLGTIKAVTDGDGVPLNYDAEKGVITGMDLGALDKEKGETWKNASIILFGDDVAYRLIVQAADLIIDDEYDFEYFAIKGDATVSANSFVYNGDDFVFDGYYVMVKNINAYNYYHVSGPNATFTPTTPSMETISKTNYGLSGVFDGQGHYIHKMVIRSFAGKSTQDGLGLFGYVNGGTIKNLKITDMYSHNTKQSGTNHVTNGMPASVSKNMFATYLIGATIQDVHFDLYRSQASAHTFFFYSADANTKINRVYIEHSDSGINANGSGMFYSNAATMEDVYVVSNIAFYTDARVKQKDAFLTGFAEEGETPEVTVLNHYWMLARLDAATVNDVTRSYCKFIYGDGSASTTYNIDDYASFTTKATGGTVISSSNPYEKSKVLTTGIKRYTTVGAMQANWTSFEAGDARRNDFSKWSSSIWTISAKGIPSMHVMTNA